MLYPKINSIYKREDHLSGNKKNLIEGDYSDPRIGEIDKWLVQEKIDGTNIRITRDNESRCLIIEGRQEGSQVPKPLKESILKNLSSSINALFDELHSKYGSDIWIFGEGYGAGIQKDGEKYKDFQSFTMFDIYCGQTDTKWLTLPQVLELANKFNIDFPSPFGIMTEKEIIEFVKSRPKSRSSQHDREIEGIIARPLKELQPVWKLKVKDYYK